jgi:hypothetical protein
MNTWGLESQDVKKLGCSQEKTWCLVLHPVGVPQSLLLKCCYEKSNEGEKNYEDA